MKILLENYYYGEKKVKEREQQLYYYAWLGMHRLAESRPIIMKAVTAGASWRGQRGQCRKQQEKHNAAEFSFDFVS